jgi:hypothetical protein
MSEDDICFPPSGSAIEDDDKVDTGCRDWTDTRQSQHSASVVHKFTGWLSVLQQNKAPHINKESTPVSIFMLFFLEMQLLVVETNRYYHQYLETVVEG